MFLRPQTRPSLLTRSTASLAVLLVMALTAFSASPELHGRLHSHSAAHHDQGSPGQANDGDDGCVVTLFAQGLVLGLALVALFFAGRILCHLANPLPERIGPPAPGYLHLPPQAPPARLS